MIIAQEILSLLPFSINLVTFHHKGENENFAIRSSDNYFYVLKKYRQDRKQRLDIDAEINLCNFLRENGLKSPQYVPFQDGSFVIIKNNSKYTLQRMILGFMICNPDEKHFFEVGKTYRKLHELKLPLTIKQKLPQLDSNTLNQAWPSLTKSKNLTQTQIDQLEHYRHESLKHLNFESSHLVHFDLHDGNIIYTENGLCMLDWEESGIGNGIFDLAVTNTRLIKLEDSTSFREALLSGYGKIDSQQLKHATIFKFLYLASFVAMYEDVLIGGETLENLVNRYLGYFKKLDVID